MSETGLVALGFLPPGESMATARKAAEVCRDVVLSNCVWLKDERGQEKRYPEIAAWQAIAEITGYAARIESVEELETGDIRAVCCLVKISDGTVISRAEGFVGTDEPQFFGGVITKRNGEVKTLKRRPMSAIRSMAQTRAMSLCYKAKLRWMLKLIDGSLGTHSPDDGEIPPDQWDEQPREREQPPRPANNNQAVTPSQRALLKRLTANLSETQLAELHEKFGPGDKLTKATASQVIEHLQNKSSHPVNEDSEPVA